MRDNKKKFKQHKAKKNNFSKKNDFAKKNYGKAKKNINSNISIEFIFYCLAQNHGKLDIASIKNAYNLSNDDINLVYDKIEMLVRKNIIHQDEHNKNIYLYNNEIVENYDIHKIIILKTIKHHPEESYSAKYFSLKQDVIKEDKFIINPINKLLMHKKILAEVNIINNTPYATPIFYLDDYRPNFNKSAKAPDMIIKGIIQKEGKDTFISPINFKSKHNILLKNASENLNNGDLISSKLITPPHEENLICEFIELLLKHDTPKITSLISAYHYDLTIEFSQEALHEANKVCACELESRKDIRNLPLITIDDEDAKDFDDALFAEPLANGAYKLYVAIADVSHYVTQGSSLDKEALERGNSVYLPSFVIPMLPHILSNGWCSLKPKEDRACILAEITINRNGIMEDYTFSKALMNSSARLTYSEVQNALGGEISEQIAPLMDSTIKPLNEVYQLLKNARIKRNALEINPKETKIILDDSDHILEIKLRESLNSHKLVEEAMIIANVAAAKFIAKNGLSQKGFCIYRVHEQPTVEKINSFLQYLKIFKINLKFPKNIDGSFFNEILERHKDDYFFNSLNELILRSQSHAKYDNINIGHFGLNLKEYAHFTSPIRRYADLMVHRLIVSIIDKEEFPYNKIQIQEICEHISKTEKVAFSAEISAKDRLLTQWFQSKIGEVFKSQVSSITRAGMFINVLSNNASGLIPMRTISSSYAFVDIDQGIIKDKDTGTIYKIGDTLDVILTEADTNRGLLTFRLNVVKKSSSKKTKLLSIKKKFKKLF